MTFAPDNPDRSREAAQRDIAVAALAELVRQIANNDFKDSHGHEALRLRAYAEAQHALARIAEIGKTEPARRDTAEWGV